MRKSPSSCGPAQHVLSSLLRGRRGLLWLQSLQLSCVRPASDQCVYLEPNMAPMNNSYKRDFPTSRISIT